MYGHVLDFNLYNPVRAGARVYLGKNRKADVVMAKVTITIEDKDNGQVSVQATPNFETLMQKEMSGNGWTGAEGIAFFLLNRAWRELKSPIKTVAEIPGIKV